MSIKLTTILLTLLHAAIVAAQSPSAIYTERVVPLLKSGGNSCSACHFQGLDLKSLFTDDPAQTFVELRSRGWVDTKQPSKSKILEFIDRHTEAETPLQRRVRTAEHEAIQAWIEAACANPALLEQPIVQHRDLAFDTKLIRHARADQIEMRFIAAIWSQLERCANCHSPDRNQKQVEKNGELMSWIVPNEPLRTLELLTDRELINLDDPDASPLRTKPAGLVKHGAGIKFPVDGETDSAWRAFLLDYSKTIRGDYATSRDLPVAEGRHRWRSGLHLRASELPEKWFGKIVVVHLYAFDNVGKVADQPIAFGESFISRERTVWSNSLELLGKHQRATLSELTQPIRIEDTMPPGKYELRIGPLQSKEWFEMQIDAPWQPGHSTALKVSVDNMQRIAAP
ncbi:MAG: hypothetical protein R3C56_25600 [Pirellulaceae bacterium]